MQYLDVLSKLGIGSAHPGGFTATLEQLKQFPIPAGASVLEVGCGTGRTSCHLASQGYKVTGLDLRDDMLAKAKKRAATLQLDIPFVQGDISDLPFEDGTFDVVLAESVTNFADVGKTLAQYYRVLKPGGAIYDRELLMLKPLPEQTFDHLCHFFGLPAIYTPERWVEMMNRVGFRDSYVWDARHFPENMTEQIPDHLESPDSGALLDYRIWQFIGEHDDIIVSNNESLGFGVMIGYK